MRLRLKIEPRPSSTWGKNLSSLLPKDQWAEMRTQCYRETDYTCENCGDTHSTLFCHEVWRFDDRKLVQHLAGLECCCKLCSDVHHFGRSTQVYGKDYIEQLVQHWCAVNEKTLKDFQKYLLEIKEISRKRANKYYIVMVGRRILA